MSEDHIFELELKDGRVAHCWQAVSQPYQGSVISAGLVEGAGPDTLYLRFARDDEEPSTFLLRPDEMMAVLHVGAGALWSAEMLRIDEESKDRSDPVEPAYTNWARQIYGEEGW